MAELSCAALPATCVLAAAGRETDGALVALLCVGRMASDPGGNLFSDLSSLVTIRWFGAFFCDLWFVIAKSLL